ncbi:hypothetical protein K492DRAFT_181791 [Lichtheimia hyalospora FSU 10163]|nr:hypothetical protein K492DRAFT_181791 [Lichtheimia hyalospora FSU 10163]
MYNQTLPTSPIPTQPAMNTTQWTSYRQQRSAPSGNNESNTNRRKYHCTEPGCNKSFTTSGHLARHNRIHTGEKNFPCLFPGCQSRFSRQDNMMQHYRTHMSPKSRRSHKRNSAGIATNVMEDDTTHRPRPRLHAHHRIRSDPFGVERPLTIDQHLNNYRLSRLSSPPLSTLSPDHSMDHHPQSPSSPATAAGQQQQQDLSALSASLQQQSLSDHPHSQLPNTTLHPLSPSSQQQQQLAKMDHSTTTATFYQHRPLTFSLEEATNTNQVPAPTTLLGPSINEQPMGMTIRQQQKDSTQQEQRHHQTNPSSSSPSSSSSSSSSDGLLQLAHVVSTFG